MITVETQPALPSIVLRHALHLTDRPRLLAIAAETGMFDEDDLAQIDELALDCLARGCESGFHFTLADHAGTTPRDRQLVGFACYGPVPAASGSYALNWLGVDPRWQGCRIGRRLIEDLEQQVQAAGGRKIFIETSGMRSYLPTQRFYQRCGYELEARLRDFYGEGDDKLIFSKSCTASILPRPRLQNAI